MVARYPMENMPCIFWIEGWFYVLLILVELFKLSFDNSRWKHVQHNHVTLEVKVGWDNKDSNSWESLDMNGELDKTKYMYPFNSCNTHTLFRNLQKRSLTYREHGMLKIRLPSYSWVSLSVLSHHHSATWWGAGCLTVWYCIYVLIN